MDRIESRTSRTARGQRHLSETGDSYVVMDDPDDNGFWFVMDNDGFWEAATRTALAAEPASSHGC